MTDPWADLIATAALVLSVYSIFTSKRADRRNRQPDLRVHASPGRPLGEYELSPFGGTTPTSGYDTVVRVQNFGPGTVKDVGFCIVTRGHTVSSVPPSVHVLSGILGVREEFCFMPFFGSVRPYETGDSICVVVFAKDEFGGTQLWSNIPNWHQRIGRFRIRKKRRLTASDAFHAAFPEIETNAATTVHISLETRPRTIP
jgi:hypothetical protein